MQGSPAVAAYQLLSSVPGASLLQFSHLSVKITIIHLHNRVGVLNKVIDEGLR